MSLLSNAFYHAFSSSAPRVQSITTSVPAPIWPATSLGSREVGRVIPAPESREWAKSRGAWLETGYTTTGSTPWHFRSFQATLFL